jgi:geranylgeranyl diphosphate synthase type 3
LTDPYRYLRSKPGKDIRTQMIASFNVWLQVPELALDIITHVIEMLHTSSLLYYMYQKSLQADFSIDDVEDGSALRRGFPVAHSIYGVPQTINSANYVYFCALRELERLDNPQLFKIFYGLCVWR